MIQSKVWGSIWIEHYNYPTRFHWVSYQRLENQRGSDQKEDCSLNQNLIARVQAPLWGLQQAWTTLSKSRPTVLTIAFKAPPSWKDNQTRWHRPLHILALDLQEISELWPTGRSGKQQAEDRAWVISDSLTPSAVPSRLGQLERTPRLLAPWGPVWEFFSYCYTTDTLWGGPLGSDACFTQGSELHSFLHCNIRLVLSLHSPKPLLSLIYHHQPLYLLLPVWYF